MRVISGKYKSLKLKTLKGQKTRPTLDKVREAIFSSIAFDNYVSILDLFAGSGAIGIEALSRGYKKVIFNDKSRQAVNVIKANLKSLNIDNNVIVYNYDYKACLKIVDKVDVIFIDPPYNSFDIEAILALITEHAVLNADGLIIVESASEMLVEEHISKYKKVKEKRYGNSKVSYFREV